MWTESTSGNPVFGGVLKSYPLDVLYEEIAFLAYYLHWSHDEIMQLEHKERVRFCSEVSRINSKMNGDSKKKNIFDV